MAAQPISDDTDGGSAKRVKNLLAGMSELDLWADVELLARNLDGVTEEQVGEIVAQLSTGDRAEPGDTITIELAEDGTEFYQYEPADGQDIPA